MKHIPSIVLCILCFSVITAHAGERPNILLILADDLGYSDLGCYGGEIRTPNLDRLAAGGIRFRQFYNTTRCCPSRASINTGLYPHQAGIGGMSGYNPNRYGYEGFLTDRCVTLAEALRTAGYRTYMSGKWHMHEKPGPIDRGFDEFFGLLGGFTSFFDPEAHTRLPADRMKRKYEPDRYYATDVFTDYALDFLADSRKKNENGRRPPFFLYLAYTAPHFPLHAPGEDIERYAETYLQGWDRIRENRYARQKEIGLLDESVSLTPRSNVPKNWANVDTGWADKDNPAWDSIDPDRRADLARRMAVFAAMVDRMDRNIGRILDDLKRNGDWDNTLILFLSDNGACAEWDPWGFDRRSGPMNILHRGAELETMGGPETYHSTGSGWANASNTPWRLYKHYIHEGGIRTPLIAHWPEGVARRGAFEDSVGHIIDFMPTFIELAGAVYPERRNGRPVLPMQGRSLLPAFEGKADTPRRLFWEHEGNRGVRDGDLKLVRIGVRDLWELYDLRTDPTEENDLSEQRPGTVEELSRAWEDWATRSFVGGVYRIDKEPGLKLEFDFTKENLEDSSGKENPFMAHGSIPIAEGGRKFDGTSRIDLPLSGTLHCAATEWIVEATIVPEMSSGVILACGGAANGYSLALREGKPVFSMTTGGRRFFVEGEKAIRTGKKTTLRGAIRHDRTITLSVDDGEDVRKKIPDLISRLPNEEMQIGLDLGSQVNEPPLPGFQGLIESIRVSRGDSGRR